MTATATKGKWTSQAGPRQTAKVNDALRALRWKGQTYTEVTGVVGGEERRSTFTSCGIGGVQTGQPGAHEAATAIGERFNWTVTRENYTEIVEAFEKATNELEIPVIDKRITPEVDAEQKAKIAEHDEKDRVRREAIDTSRNAILAKRPHSAHAIIVAELNENTSDLMSDYHNHKTTRYVAIGWRRGNREDFKQLRLAAGEFSETKHLGPGCEIWYVTIPSSDGAGYRVYVSENGLPACGGDRMEFPTQEEAEAWIGALGLDQAKSEFESIEHRENYSMGAGNYLKAGSRDSSGWCVKSHDLPGGLPHAVIEDCLPRPGAMEQHEETVSGRGLNYEVQKHHHTKKGFDFYIVVLADRVERDVFERLRNSCQAANGWYSRAWGKTPGGFGFKNQQDANAWAEKYVK